MSTKTEYKPRNVKIFELDEFEKLLIGLRVATCMLTENPNLVVDEESVIRRVSALTLGGASGSGAQCSCCGAGPFESRAQQTAHYKLHWHTYNLKRRLFGKPPLTLPQFDSRQDDNSSVSGSDSEGEGAAGRPASDLFAAATRHCKAFFANERGQVFCIYRCVLHHRKEDLSTDGDGKQWVQRCAAATLPGNQRWALLMVSGGHFAGAIFAGGAAVLHKTQHSYVVRRGQGQAQGTRDQHSNAPRSAGASLRRYNQAQFLQHVQEIIAAWADELAGCSLVLYRAVGPNNQAALFSKGSPLSRDDLRVRALPFPTRKPTYKELQRAHATVANVEVYDSLELFQKALVASRAKPVSDGSTSDRPARKASKSSPGKPIDRAKSREPAPRELPTQMLSSEDEGPTFIDSETPVDWIKTLSEQARRGLITNSRKDLLNDQSVGSPSSESEDESVPKENRVKKKKKKKPNNPPEGEWKKEPKKPPPQKIHNSVKRIWKAITGTEEGVCLETIFEKWEAGTVAVGEACNTPDPADGNTALHKAAIAAKPEMVTQILAAGGDPCARNHQQQTPYAASPHPDTRVAFRLFQADHPDKYNYAKSHIPGPITPQQLEAERERKAAQKKAKRQRDKERQIEKIRTVEFLQLKDADKLKAAEERCFLCGVQLPRKPFQYERFSFCSIQCLQNHRNLRPLKMAV